MPHPAAARLDAPDSSRSFGMTGRARGTSTHRRCFHEGLIKKTTTPTLNKSQRGQSPREPSPRSLMMTRRARRARLAEKAHIEQSRHPDQCVDEALRSHPCRGSAHAGSASRAHLWTIGAQRVGQDHHHRHAARSGAADLGQLQSAWIEDEPCRRAASRRSHRRAAVVLSLSFRTPQPGLFPGHLRAWLAQGAGRPT